MIRTMLFLSTILLMVPVAEAAPITFNFTGVVTSVSPELSSEFADSELVVGSYTFESTTPDSDPGDTTTGVYENSISAFIATIGGDYTVTEGLDNEIFIADGLPGNDVYAVLLTDPTAPSVNGLDLALFFLGVIDTNADVFSSDALPLSLPNFSEFENASSGGIYFDDPANRSINFRLTSINVVPEPSSLILLAGAAFTFGCYCRSQIS